MKILFRWIIISLVIIAISYVSPGIIVENLFAALVAAIVLSLITLVFKPILVILTLPINIVTLGLFTFVINAILILLTSAIVPGFMVVSFWWALLLSLAVSVTNIVLNKENKSKK